MAKPVSPSYLMCRKRYLRCDRRAVNDLQDSEWLEEEERERFGILQLKTRPSLPAGPPADDDKQRRHLWA